MTNPVAVPAVRRQMRELVDGTIEVRLHIEPMHRTDFLALFPTIDMPVALAPLSIGAAQAYASTHSTAKARPEPGDDCGPENEGPAHELSRMAAMLCKNKVFHEYLQEEVPNTFHVERLDCQGDLEEAAKRSIYYLAGITSRAELDTNARAADRFHTYVRIPFVTWARLNGHEERER